MTSQLNSEELTEAFEYLDELRASGRTNMFGARAYVEDELGWDKREAGAALKLWMDTFDGEAAMEQRVAQAIEAQRAETVKQGSVEDESAVAAGDAPKGSSA